MAVHWHYVSPPPYRLDKRADINFPANCCKVFLTFQFNFSPGNHIGSGSTVPDAEIDQNCFQHASPQRAEYLLVFA